MKLTRFAHAARPAMPLATLAMIALVSLPALAWWPARRAARAPAVPPVSVGANGGAVEPPSTTDQILALMTLNMTERARAGGYEPFVGRGADLLRVEDSLKRRSNRSVWIVADKGQGKTAIVEALAGRPGEAAIYQLDLAALVAKTAHRGDLENRVRALVAIFSKDQNKILFVDEAHLLLDYPAFTEILKPALERGAISSILATTTEGIRKVKRQNAAFVDRAQVVTLERYSPEEVLDILRSRRLALEAHFGARLSDAAMAEAVRLARRYYPGSTLTRKSIELLETAMSRLRSEAANGGLDLAVLRDRAARLKREEESLLLDLPHLREGHDRDVAGARLEELVGLQEEAAQHIAQLQARAARGAAVPSAVATDKRPAVAPEYLREIVGVEFGQTPERVARTTKEALQDFAQETRARIRGQDHALKTVEATLRRRLTNAVPDGEGPLGAYVFSGPTGVGKTAVALAINGSLFVADSLFRLDMSEYMEKHSVSRLIGAPPGYVGFDEGGVLTNAVHENGERVILFDEIEKAHEDVRNILLQVLGSGRLTDGNGTVVDFKNTIVVVTTNIGAEYSMDRISMGVAEIESKYGFPPGSLAALSAAERDQRVVERLLKLHGWKDEEINRYSALISMNPISEETAIEIVRKNLDEIVEHNRRENHRVVTYDENVPVELARASLDPLYGARPLKRSLVSVVGGAISTAFLDERLLRGQVIRLSIEPGADGPGLVASAEDTPLGRERLPTRFFGSTAASREMAGTSEAGDGASSDGPGAERAAGVSRCGDFFGNARGRTGIKRDGASAADELIPGLETLVVPERFRARAR